MNAAAPLERLYACLDRANLAIFSDEQASIRSVVALVEELVHAIPWHHIETDDLLALPLAAQVLAGFGLGESAIVP